MSVTRVFRRFAAFAIGAVSVAHAQGDEIQTEMVIPYAEVQSLQVNLNMREGNLFLSQGTKDLLRSLFTYAEGQARPQLRYELEDSRARVELNAQAKSEQWEIYLTEKIPIDLQVASRTGDMSLELDGLRMRELALNGGMGSVTVQSRGSQPDLKHLVIEHQVGNIEADLTGKYSDLSLVDIRGARTELVMDLRGQFERDARVKIHLENGSCSLKLPKDIGVIVAVVTSQGEIVKKGLSERSKGVLVNSPYGKSAVTLNVDLHVQHGNVFLEGE